MKGKTQLFTVITILFLLFLTPQKSTAFQKATGTIVRSQSNVSGKINSGIILYYEKVLIDGVWWIFVYDNGKLIESYPE